MLVLKTVPYAAITSEKYLEYLIMRTKEGAVIWLHTVINQGINTCPTIYTLTRESFIEDIHGVKMLRNVKPRIDGVTYEHFESLSLKAFNIIQNNINDNYVFIDCDSAEDHANFIIRTPKLRESYKSPRWDELWNDLHDDGDNFEF